MVPFETYNLRIRLANTAISYVSLYLEDDLAEPIGGVLSSSRREDIVKCSGTVCGTFGHINGLFCLFRDSAKVSCLSGGFGTSGCWFP